MVATRSFVAASDGPLAGMTVTVANWTAFSCCSSAAWSRGSSPATGGTTAATSVPIDRSSSTAVPTAATGSSAFLVSTTTTSGPLMPAPKFSEIRSYASRLSLPAGAVPLSGSASSIEATGIEITAAAARPTTRAGTLNRGDELDPATAVGASVVALGVAVLQELHLSCRHPLAGETEQRGQQGEGDQDGDRHGRGTAPGPSGSGTRCRSTESPTRAMITVRPAKTTAEPAVPTATPTASSVRDRS